jgi:predicted SnoaL-like aldol condensation-catalyzing enzyme
MSATQTSTTQASRRKNIVTDFFRIVGTGRPKDGLKYFASNCVQHNPYVHGGMDALLESMTAAFKEGASKFPEADFRVRSVLEEGDMLAVYTQLLNSRSRPEMGGLRQVHLFRFNEDKIVEYWDITQMIESNMPNAAGAF